MPHPILLYDGVCGLCNRLVQFILKRDPNAIFRFASLQSALAARILATHEINPTQLDTIYVVLHDERTDEGQPTESLLARSDAVLFVLQQLGGFWREAARLFQVIPHPLRDGVYRVVARARYRVFGEYETCPIPAPEHRTRFLDQ